MTKPVQVYLDDDDFDRLDAFARARGWSKSQVIRAAIRALTRRSADDPLLELSGDIDGLPEDLTENIDWYLNETFVAEKPAPPYGSRRRRAPKAAR
jgi:predicted transcriptional regulator